MRLIPALIVALFVTAVPAGLAHAQVVTDVESGDEIVVSGLGKVKLIGIEHTDPGAFSLGGDTAPPARTGPEQRPPSAIGGAIALGRKQPARDLLRKLVLGRTVRVEYDPLVDDRSKGAYIFVDDVLVNVEMVRQGRATVESSTALVHEQALLDAADEAKASGLGIWTRVK